MSATIEAPVSAPASTSSATATKPAKAKKAKATKPAKKAAKKSAKAKATNGKVIKANPTVGLEMLKGRGRWNSMKVKVFKAIKKAGDGTTEEVAKAGSVESAMVRHYGYRLAADGLVTVSGPFEDEGRTYHFKLSAAGSRFDVDKALAEQKAAKK